MSEAMILSLCVFSIVSI